MKKTSIKYSLDKRRERKNQKYPLIIRLTHKGRTTSISTGLEFIPSDWDDVRGGVLSGYKGTHSIVRLNNNLQKHIIQLKDKILMLDEEKRLNDLSLVQLRTILTENETQTMFGAFTSQLIIELKKSNRNGTARSYGFVRDSVIKFNNGNDMSMNTIDYSFLKKYESDYLSRGNSYNGLAVYMRTIRAIINKAIKMGLAKKEKYPFAEYKIRTTPTKKRTIGIESLSKVLDANFTSNPHLKLAHSIFCASFFLMGINYTDLAHLKKKDIVNSRIKYQRKKTGQHFDIKISEQLQVIFKEMERINETSEYIFPIIKNNEPYEIEKRIQWSRKNYNSRLKMIGKVLNIDETLTSYVSRHTFASLAKNKGIPVTAISEMLGHRSIKTTQIYLDSLSSDAIDKFHSQIISV